MALRGAEGHLLWTRLLIFIILFTKFVGEAMLFFVNLSKLVYKDKGLGPYQMFAELFYLDVIMDALLARTK
jgi:hypothetical protein